MLNTLIRENIPGNDFENLMKDAMNRIKNINQ
jgi:hypothetical protein